ncbi:26685_t:CDS:1 [Dentiscutata erythropus]|uniref:26685_t:CDS:1 n=1 Tax=Dentiscutata erythropus TaxID=1348616 RepID=A0A9N9BK14_9GLOM|nr:26685_t:CDS:1 [Dentiscutata erythropus]
MLYDRNQVQQILENDEFIPMIRDNINTIYWHIKTTKNAFKNIDNQYDESLTDLEELTPFQFIDSDNEEDIEPYTKEEFIQEFKNLPYGLFTSTDIKKLEKLNEQLHQEISFNKSIITGYKKIRDRFNGGKYLLMFEPQTDHE